MLKQMCDCFCKHFMFFKERAATSETYQEKCAKIKIIIKINIKTMETSPPKRKPITFMYFWLNYVDKGHMERIDIAVKNIGYLFYMASEVIEADTLHLFLLSDGTRIDEDEYLARTRYRINYLHGRTNPEILIYLELKRYFSLKNISYPLNIDYFLWYSKITLMFIEVVISGTCPVLFKVFFNSLYIWI